MSFWSYRYITDKILDRDWYSRNIVIVKVIFARVIIVVKLNNEAYKDWSRRKGIKINKSWVIDLVFRQKIEVMRDFTLKNFKEVCSGLVLRLMFSTFLANKLSKWMSLRDDWVFHLRWQGKTPLWRKEKLNSQ